jgi:hypothetical protein
MGQDGDTGRIACPNELASDLTDPKLRLEMADEVEAPPRVVHGRWF